MDNMDLELEQRVWQRVTGGAESEDSRILVLMLRAEEAAAVYHALSRNASGDRREKLNGLYRDAQSCAAALRGMLRMEAQPVRPRQNQTVTRGSLQHALSKAYRRAAQNLQDYSALSVHPDFGPVFLRMSDREADHMHTLLELIGTGEGGR